jgi:hypothetical protein
MVRSILSYQWIFCKTHGKYFMLRPIHIKTFLPLHNNYYYFVNIIIPATGYSRTLTENFTCYGLYTCSKAFYLQLEDRDFICKIANNHSLTRFLSCSSYSSNADKINTTTFLTLLLYYTWWFGDIIVLVYWLYQVVVLIQTKHPIRAQLIEHLGKFIFISCDQAQFPRRTVFTKKVCMIQSHYIIEFWINNYHSFYIICHGIMPYSSVINLQITSVTSSTKVRQWLISFSRS